MTIQSHVRALNDRLSNLETCAEKSPAGMYVRAKAAAEAVGNISNAVMAELRDQGFKASNNDHLRNLEAAIYGYLLASNPDEHELIAAEGFGKHKG